MTESKRGFTLVELVVIIAVIAVLAAVLIPTFIKIMERAEMSKDMQIVRNLNQAIIMDGKRHDTMYSVLNIAKQYGYDIDKINSTADKKILWDSVNDCFVYLDGEYPKYLSEPKVNQVDSHQMWMIANSIPSDQKYSIYAGKGWDDEEIRGLTVGFDVGDNSSIRLVEYVGDKAVTIRTAGKDTQVVVDNVNAAVRYYGEARSVDIKNASQKSVHISGKVTGNVIVNSGHVVIDRSAEVTTVIIKGEGVKVDVTANTYVTVGVARGIFAQVVGGIGIEVDTQTTDLFAGGIGTKQSPYLIFTAADLGNISKLENSMQGQSSTPKQFYFKLMKDIAIDQTIGVEAFCGEFDGNGYTITVHDEDNSIAASIFGDIHGEAYIHDLTVAYGKRVRSIVNIAANHSSKSDFENLKFENITTKNAQGYTVSDGVGYPNYSLFATFTQKAQFINCTNEANVNFGSTYAAIFFGYTVGNRQSRISFINCHNMGIVTGSSCGMFSGNPTQASACYVLSVRADFADVPEAQSAVYVSDCGNSGIIKGTFGAGIFAVTSTSARHNDNVVSLNKSIVDNGSFKEGIIIDGSSKKIAAAVENNKVVITQPVSGASRYEISCYVHIKLGDSYVYFRINHSYLTSDGKVNYISKAIGDKEYEVSYGKRYQDIEGDALVGYDGFEYKLVKLADDSYMAVFNASAKYPNLEVLTGEKQTSYLITAYDDSGVVIANEVYPSGSIAYIRP